MKRAMIHSPNSTDARPSPERTRHASLADLEMNLTDEHTPSGQKTGRQYRKLEHVLESAHRRRWIDEDQLAAGMRFRTHIVGAKLEPSVVAQYGERISSGAAESTGEARQRHIQQLRGSMLAISAQLRSKFYDFMQQAEYADVSIGDFGAMFSTLKHVEALKGAGISILKLILSDLAAHYGMTQTARRPLA